jgi:hypothetical protein
MKSSTVKNPIEQSIKTKNVMRRSRRRGIGFFVTVTAVVMLAPFVLTTVAWAQNAASEPEGKSGEAPEATLRTLEDMQASEAAHPAVPMAIPPNLPTMDFEQYLNLKKRAPAPGAVVRPGAGLAPAAPPTLGPLHCNGLGQSAPIVQGFFPPDTHGAVGRNHFGQIVNSGIKFYSKALTGNCPTSNVLTLSLFSFFGYTNQALFDPRILYDLTYNRWIVSVEAFPESPTVQLQFIAVSVDSDPTHGFFIYSFNATGFIGINGAFWDYPQIGYDEDAVILTANKFNPGFIGATVVWLPKHRMYAGLGFSFCFFNNAALNVGTFTPPIVLDQGPYTTIASVRLGLNLIRVTKWTNGAHACPTFLDSDDIAGATTTVPPSAQQPGFPPCATNDDNCLDTLDGRFQSQGTQNGSPVFGSPVKFWQVRTDAAGILPTPHTYRVNADALEIEEDCEFFTSQTSMDFNPSIVANGAGNLFVNWSATDPVAGFNAQVRLGGKLLADDCSVIGPPGVLVNQSANALTGNFDPDHGLQRWGDTSAITLDPSNTSTVYGVNEKVQANDGGPNRWKSFIFNAHNP